MTLSMSTVHATLSGLKTCQTDIGTGMDIVTDVAMDLVEAQEGEEHADLGKLEALVLDCARLDREISCFLDVVQRVTAEASQQPAEDMFTLSSRVKVQFTETMARLSDAELHNHRKVVAFKESIRNPVTEETPEGGEDMEDEDVAVTQTQVNFSCPLTTVEMVNPMRNKSCNHHYDEEAILNLIRAKHRQLKKCRCPVVGCGNSDVTESDLVLDQKLRRMIQQNKGRQNSRT